MTRVMTTRASVNRENAAWLREQLDDLGEHAVLFSRPLTAEQMRVACLAIKRGVDWRSAISRTR